MNSIWIARDKNGVLFAFSVKPVRNDLSDAWVTDDDLLCCCMHDDWFPEVTWENSPIELVIEEKEE